MDFAKRGNARLQRTANKTGNLFRGPKSIECCARGSERTSTERLVWRGSCPRPSGYLAGVPRGLSEARRFKLSEGIQERDKFCPLLFERGGCAAGLQPSTKTDCRT